VPFVVGGPHVTLYPTKSIDLTGADITVAGEAEDSILPLVKAVTEGGPTNPALSGKLIFANPKYLILFILNDSEL
jgi:radical SAM superfamily enzyme YgiQ (UPF0313 family)